MASIRRFPFQLLLAALVSLTASIWPAAAAIASDSWQDPSNRAVLKNQSMEATFQAGQLCELQNLSDGSVLLSVDPAQIPSRIPLFGSSSIDLSACAVRQTLVKNTLTTTLTANDGSIWTLEWKIEPKKGDLVLNSSFKANKPIDEMRVLFFGADIATRQLVWVDNVGISNVAKSPAVGPIALGNPIRDSAPNVFVHPLVALFQGSGSGWFVEGRDERIGPSCLMIYGTGDKANLGMTRKFTAPANEAKMYEIRFRTYDRHWADAVDPYTQWLQTGAGLMPLDKLPRSISFVKNITNQTYIRASDFANLDRFAKDLDPKRTFLGRMPIYRKYQVDFNYPDYEPNEMAAKWIRQAADMGFHVGPWYNTYGIAESKKDLLKLFRPGLLPIGRNDKGEEIFDGVRGYTIPMIYCSPAYKPWRDYLIAQMKGAIDCGADVVHLDQAQSPCGPFMVDGVNGIEGELLLMKEIMEKYPGVAVETEQVNPMTAKYGKLCIIQMPLGHPLSGYIYRKFVKICPDSYTSSPMFESLLDAVQSYGFMLPSGLPGSPDSDGFWAEYARAFQDYSLVPDVRLPHTEFTTYTGGYGGVVPVQDFDMPAEGIKLFGYRGKNGVTAYWEKHKGKRGLVVYEPGKEPKWVGTVHYGVTEWSGGGGLKNYIIYNNGKTLALNPTIAYYFDTTVATPENAFHVFEIPSDFTPAFDDYVDRWSAPGQRHTADGSFYSLRMSGHGQLGVHIPQGYQAFLDGKELIPDPATRKCAVQVSAEADNPVMLIGFRNTDKELDGLWVELPWQVPANQRSWHLSRHNLMDNLIDGPSRLLKDGDGFFNHVAGMGVIIGQFPEAKKIRLQGAWGMRHEVVDTVGDGVIRINGQEVLRMKPGRQPFPLQCFDVDVTKFAGQHVAMEFLTDGKVHGDSAADWYTPQVIVER